MRAAARQGHAQLPRNNPQNFNKIGCALAETKQVRFCSALAAPSGDFKAFARELFLSDYDMGDGGHVFLHLLRQGRTQRE